MEFHDTRKPKRATDCIPIVRVVGAATGVQPEAEGVRAPDFNAMAASVLGAIANDARNRAAMQMSFAFALMAMPKHRAKMRPRRALVRHPHMSREDRAALHIAAAEDYLRAAGRLGAFKA